MVLPRLTLVWIAEKPPVTLEAGDAAFLLLKSLSRFIGVIGSAVALCVVGLPA